MEFQTIRRADASICNATVGGRIVGQIRWVRGAGSYRVFVGPSHDLEDAGTVDTLPKAKNKLKAGLCTECWQQPAWFDVGGGTCRNCARNKWS